VCGRQRDFARHHHDRRGNQSYAAGRRSDRWPHTPHSEFGQRKAKRMVRRSGFPCMHRSIGFEPAPGMANAFGFIEPKVGKGLGELNERHL